jgi:uncharacterized protein YjbI with pentapeptide repeats
MSHLSKEEILDRAAAGASLRGMNLIRSNLPSAQLRGADLTETNLRMANLSGANLRDARLTGSSLSGAILNEAVLAGANLVEASLIGTVLRDADLARVDLSGADLTGANLQGSNLSGAYLVGAFLSETNLVLADLTGAFMRMAQLCGSDLSGTILDGADLSNCDLSGVRMEGCSLVGANLQGANLSASWLIGCDLRRANLQGANLGGCNLTGARLNGVSFDGASLDDAWAEWVDLSADGNGERRGSLEQVFVGVLGKPVAQVMVACLISTEVWSGILAHLSAFQKRHPNRADVRLRAFNQGTNSSVLYLESETEVNLAAYLAEFADIAGKGSVDLFEKLATVLAQNAHGLNPPADSPSMAAEQSSIDQSDAVDVTGIDDDPLEIEIRGEPQPFPVGTQKLEGTDFWDADKAFAILSANREIWLESSSDETLTLRPPRGSVTGLDLVRGRFVPIGPQQNTHSNQPQPASQSPEQTPSS